MSLTLNLSDRMVDLVNEGFDCSVRVGDLPDNRMVALRLADNQRQCVATPDYLRRAGTPQHPSELVRHQCLTLSSQNSQVRGWVFRIDGEIVALRPSGRLDCSDGQVLYEWCLQGLGLAWRSTWEVARDMAEGRLVSVLDDYVAPPNGIYAVFRSHAICRCGCACGWISSSIPMGSGLLAASCTVGPLTHHQYGGWVMALSSVNIHMFRKVKFESNCNETLGLQPSGQRLGLRCAVRME